MLIDTHIHLYSKEFDPDRNLLMRLAKDAGVEKFLLPNIDVDSRDVLLSLCDQYTSCYPMMGLHPCSVTDDYREQLDKIYLTAMANKGRLVAIGEIGLDFHWDVTFRKQQEIAFREQVCWASELNLPVVIHSRESTDAIIEKLQSMEIKKHNGVFHCFSGTLKQAQIITEMGYMLGIGGVVTFKNSGLDKVVAEMPLEKMVLETDGPYLAPVPFRGKRNEPAYIKLVAQKIAEIKQVTLENVCEITSANASRLFNIPLS